MANVVKVDRREINAHEFTMGFVEISDRFRAQHIDKWQEVVANFAVTPFWENRGRMNSPYRYGQVYQTPRQSIVLKDPETHKVIMTYASLYLQSLFGDPRREYVSAKPTGHEDAPQKAPTVTRLLRYAFGLPGHYRSFLETLIDMLLFGTSMVQVGWRYDEREMPVRSVATPVPGFDTSTTGRFRVPVYDDVEITPLDVKDFYPDPSEYRMHKMRGAAKRFRMRPQEALGMARKGIYDEMPVRKAISNLSNSATMAGGEDRIDKFREGLDQPSEKEAHSSFKEMIGYEYWGDVPWVDDEGSARRVITVLNNVVVRDRPFPLADPHLPFHSFVINPVQGRFYGLSPAEVIRYDQSLADAIKVLLAQAMIRRVHPPIAYDPDAELGHNEIAKLRAWRADTVVPVRGGPKSIGTLQYDIDVLGGFGFLQGLQASMQGGSGAGGAVQGEPGPSREPANIGVRRMQAAMARTDLGAQLIEEDCLPMIGKAVLRRYQQFLPDSAALAQRIGEMPQAAWIGDIMGDFDVSFHGSRKSISRQEKLQSIDRLVALSAAVPPFMVQIPWDQIAYNIVGETLELADVAAKMQDPNSNTALMNTLLSSVLGQGGGQSPRASQAPGTLTETASGGTV
jgi:hypothetical protein